MPRRALLLFAAMSVIWGIPYLFIRVAVAEISPATLVFVRTAIAALILLPIALVRRDLRAALAHWRWVLAFAVAELVVPWIALFSAEQRVTSALAALLVAGVPIAGTLIAFLTGARHRFGRAGWAGLALGLVGVALIVGLDLEATDPLALAEMALVVVGYAIGPAILARRLAGVPSVGIMALALAACALVYLPLAVALWPATLPGPDTLGSVAILAVVCTALAFLRFPLLVAEVGPVRVTLITYVNPAVAALLGVLVLREPFTLAMGAGFVLVLLGSALATRAPAGPGSPAGADEPLAEVAPA